MEAPQDIPLFTRAQVIALHAIWIHHFIDGRKENHQFASIVQLAQPILAGDGAIGIYTPTGLFIGIEPDGHQHT